MTREVSACRLKAWLHDGKELSLLDAREHGQYGEAHPFYAVPLPYSRLELDIGTLVPRTGTRIVLYDGGQSGVAARAAARLDDLGYGDVSLLAGGTAGWQAAGYPLFAGVNVPSKTFGELVEHQLHTPRVNAAELDRLLREDDNLVVIDGRPVSEYRKMNIPGSLCCPNGELAYRIGQIAPDPATRIVINCAGRTRSIIGAQTLINLGIPNPVHALEDGTQGWTLAGLALEHGSSRRYPEIRDTAALQSMRHAARALGERHGVRMVSADTVTAWFDDASRTTYVFDIRTHEEYAAGHVPGSVHAPGGQLIQATDQWVGVHNARIVLVDTEDIRARVAASWLRQMGHDAWVLNGGANAALRVPVHDTAARLPALVRIDAATLRHWLDAGECRVFDLRHSMAFRQARIPGAQWAIRPRLDATRAASHGLPVVFVADDPGMARIAAHDLALASAALLDGGLAAWRDAGYPLDTRADVLPDTACIDYLFFVHDRHCGNKAAARQYLAWEKSLIGQLDAREIGQFRIA